MVDKNISVAFEDLDKLMEMVGVDQCLETKSRLHVEPHRFCAEQTLRFVPFQAKDMVNLSKDITNKVRDKKGEISEDEVCTSFIPPTKVRRCHCVC